MTAVPRIIWKANPPMRGKEFSSQALFLTCPYPEALLEGGRGGGKTSVLLMDFAQDCGRGFGAEWVGMLLRRSFQDLSDVVAKSQALFPFIFPRIRFYESKSDYFWEWATGERLYFKHLDNASQYFRKFHGHAYPWQGFEELSSWPDLKVYQILSPLSRSAHPEVAKLARRRSTTNPWGPGHGAVKAYFIDPAPTGHPIEKLVTIPAMNGKPARVEAMKRVRYYAPLEENIPLVESDPGYLGRILGDIEDEALRKAWAGGADRWEIAAGAFFADVWRKAVHVLPAWKPPAHWKVTRSLDWGSSAPFAVQWYAESPGETVTIRNRSIFMPRGTLVLFMQWYGASAPNVGLRMGAVEVARGILKREREAGIVPSGGVADSAMWNDVNPSHPSAGKDFAAEGVKLEPCTKGPGSRVHAWAEIRKRLTACLPVVDQNGTPVKPEFPGLYITDSCVDVIRTLPTLERDPHNPDDIDSSQDDHDADALGYRVMWKLPGTRTSRPIGNL